MTEIRSYNIDTKTYYYYYYYYYIQTQEFSSLFVFLYIT
jgi:hypothetical protein